MRVLLLSIYLLLPMIALGVPAKRVAKVVTQPDGTTLTITARGDEFLHYFVDENGQIVHQNETTGWWEPYEIPQQTKQRAALRRNAAANRRELRAKARTEGRKSNGLTGNKRGIVILVQFPDKQFCESNTQAVFNDIFNKPEYTDKYGSIGSVRDYFLAQSYGRLSIDFDVIGPITVSKNHDYYGENNASGDDLHPAELVIEAVTAVAAETDFRNYDWDGDGMVDQVFVIFAGTGEASSHNKNDIWPHEWTLNDARFYGDGNGAVTINGATINTYACSNELYNSRSSKIEGMGTACHEFSHCLGLPDIYDTTGNNFGMDVWDMMDYGMYNCDGYVPCSYTAYERWFAGWTDPVILDDGCKIEAMKNIDESGECYTIYNRAHPDEFYILQNIRKQGWNSYAKAEGMLIIHVDYDSNIWYENTVNTVYSHQRISPVCCDNKATSASVIGDLWPYKGNDSLTDSSAPAAKLFNANDDGSHFLGRPITDITQNPDGTISFTFNGGSPDAAIKEVTVSTPRDKQLFDITGRAITGRPSHGLYIKNGKKLLVKGI